MRRQLPTGQGGRMARRFLQIEIHGKLLNAANLCTGQHCQGQTFSESFLLGSGQTVTRSATDYAMIIID